MNVDQFARIAPRIKASLEAGVRTVAMIKATVPTTALKTSWVFAGDGDGWIIYSVFGRRILLRAEVEWNGPEPKSRVLAFLEEYHDDRCAFHWVSLDVSVEEGQQPVNDEGEAVSPEWFLLEGVLSALQSRSTIFRSEAPNRAN